MTAYQATLRGVTFGADTVYEHAEAPAGFGVPDIRSGDVPIPRGDGVIAGDDFLAARVVVFDLWVLGDTDVDVEASARSLKAAFAPSREDIELVVALSGDPVSYSLFGRPRGCELSLAFLPQGVGRVRAVFLATDPRLLAAESTAGISLPAGSAGLVFPADAPFAFGALSSSGEAIVSNTGTVDADWTATIDGPVVGPRIEWVEGGVLLSLPSLTVPAGDTLEFDSRTRSVMLDGSASRYSSLSTVSRWWRLPPGDSTIRYRAVSGSGGLTFRHRPASL